MALNSSGQISLGSGSIGQSVNSELGKSQTAEISMNDADVRTLAQKTGFQQTISFEDFWGKPISPTPTPSISITPTRTPSVTRTPSFTPSPTFTPTRTPTPTPTPSPNPNYYYTVTYCSTSIQSQIVSSVTLSVGLYYFGNDGQCFYVDSYDGETFATPNITGATLINDCNSQLCIQ